MTISKSNTRKKSAKEKKKPVMAMLLFGCISATGYFYLMTHQELITGTFTRGGWYAAFPILAALCFSFIHGAFASNFLSFLGLEAKK